MADPQNDNSGTGVVLGILIAVILIAGGYFFLKSEGQVPGEANMTNIEMPDVNIATPDNQDGADAPAVEPAAE